MKTSTKLALAFLGLASLAGGVAYAEGRHGPDGKGAMLRFDRLDADQSGDITFDEFAAMLKSRIRNADANNDGKMTVEELAAEIEKMRAERMAKRLIERFDTDGDGMLTTAEVEARQKKMFALMDRNDDGKIVPDELPSGKWRRHGGFGRW